MNWGDQPWVKLYTRNPPEWSLLSVAARGLFCLLMREVDRGGWLEIGKLEPDRALAVLLHCQPGEICAALAELLTDGCVEQRPGGLLLPNFAEAQEARMSNAERQRRKRQKARSADDTKSVESDTKSVAGQPSDTKSVASDTRRHKKCRERHTDLSLSLSGTCRSESEATRRSDPQIIEHEPHPEPEPRPPPAVACEYDYGTDEGRDRIWRRLAKLYDMAGAEHGWKSGAGALPMPEPFELLRLRDLDDRPVYTVADLETAIAGLFAPEDDGSPSFYVAKRAAAWERLWRDRPHLDRCIALGRAATTRAQEAAGDAKRPAVMRWVPPEDTHAEPLSEEALEEMAALLGTDNQQVVAQREYAEECRRRGAA